MIKLPSPAKQQLLKEKNRQELHVSNPASSMIGVMIMDTNDSIDVGMEWFPLRVLLR